jgi:hypothetical protein
MPKAALGEIALIRDAKNSDLPIIQAIHRTAGWDFPLPDFASPLIIANKVATGPEGVIGSCFLQLTAEAVLLLDPALDPRRKFNAIQELNDAVTFEAWRLGLNDLNARTSPETTQRFSKRLIQLGWQQTKPGWSAWSRRVDERFNDSE